MTDFTELKRLMEASTPGPWTIEYGDGNEMRFVYVIASDKLPVAMVDDFLEVNGWTLDPKDFAFIAAAKNTLPAMFERMERLKGGLIEIMRENQTEAQITTGPFQEGYDKAISIVSEIARAALTTETTAKLGGET